jgi:tetratricopeptide (TPR) repeat protein
MKRLLTLTLCLIATASPCAVLADPCDNLRNNQQAYRDCVNDWYGRSNRGSAPTPWWKNYDPNAGSGSAPAEGPQQYRPFAPRYVPPPNPNERARRLANFDVEMGRVDSLIQEGNNYLLSGKPKDASRAFAEANGIIHWYDGYRPGDTRSRLCQISENIAHAEVQIGKGDPEYFFKKSVALQDEYARQTTPIPKGDIAEYNRSLNALATFYENQGRLTEAAELHRRRLAHTERSVGNDHPETINARHALNRVTVRREPVVKHDEMFKRLNAMNEALQRENYATTLKASEDLLVWARKENNDGLAALAQRNKAKALTQLGRGDEAHKLLTDLLATLDKTPMTLSRSEGFGSKQSDLYETLRSLADEHESRSSAGYAEPYRRRMLEIQEKTRGPDHLETLAALRGLGRTLSAQGKYLEAVPVQQRAVALAEKLPAAQNQLPRLRTDLSTLYRQAGGFEQEALALDVLIDWKGAWNRLNEDASKSFKARQYAQAIEKGQVALNFAQKHGASDNRLATSQSNLAVYYRADKQYEQAESFYKKALETHTRVSGPESSSLVIPLRELSALYELQKRFAEAEPLYKRLLPLQEKKHGLEHAEVAKTLSKLADLHAREKRFAEAETLFTRALAIADKQVPADESLLISVLGGLAWVYRDTGREDEASRLDQRREKLL